MLYQYLGVKLDGGGLLARLFGEYDYHCCLVTYYVGDGDLCETHAEQPSRR